MNPMNLGDNFNVKFLKRDTHAELWTPWSMPKRFIVRTGVPGAHCLSMSRFSDAGRHKRIEDITALRLQVGFVP